MLLKVWWKMDMKQVIAWLIPVMARGIAWILAAKLGLDAVEGKAIAGEVANWIGAGVLLAVSIYTSVKGRKRLLNTPPPEK